MAYLQNSKFKVSKYYINKIYLKMKFSSFLPSKIKTAITVLFLAYFLLTYFDRVLARTKLDWFNSPLVYPQKLIPTKIDSINVCVSQLLTQSIAPNNMLKYYVVSKPVIYVVKTFDIHCCKIHF